MDCRPTPRHSGWSDSRYRRCTSLHVWKQVGTGGVTAHPGDQCGGESGNVPAHRICHSRRDRMLEQDRLVPKSGPLPSSPTENSYSDQRNCYECRCFRMSEPRPKYLSAILSIDVCGAMHVCSFSLWNGSRPGSARRKHEQAGNHMEMGIEIEGGPPVDGNGKDGFGNRQDRNLSCSTDSGVDHQTR